MKTTEREKAQDKSSAKIKNFGRDPTFKSAAKAGVKSVVKWFHSKGYHGKGEAKDCPTCNKAKK